MVKEVEIPSNFSGVTVNQPAKSFESAISPVSNRDFLKSVTRETGLGIAARFDRFMRGLYEHRATAEEILGSPGDYPTDFLRFLLQVNKKQYREKSKKPNSSNYALCIAQDRMVRHSLKTLTEFEYQMRDAYEIDSETNLAILKNGKSPVRPHPDGYEVLPLFLMFSRQTIADFMTTITGGEKFPTEELDVKNTYDKPHVKTIIPGVEATFYQRGVTSLCAVLFDFAAIAKVISPGSQKK